MKRIPTLTLVVSLFAAASAFAAIDGAWTAGVREKNPAQLHFEITRGDWHNMGMTMDIADFTGLTPAMVNAATMTPVRFELRREAGNGTFEGTFRNGKGAGQMDFVADRSYIDKVKALGVEFRSDRKHKQSDEEWLFTLALHDVSTAFIRAMQSEGFRVPLEKYLNMRVFDITPEYIREMRSLGFKDLDADDVINSRIHRVTPQYVREMRAAGWNLSLRELQNGAIHGATPAFAQEMKKAGYPDLDYDDLVTFRIHRVTPEFIQELRTLGYDKIPADKLVAMRIHRVTPEFIRELKAAGYSRIPVQKLISMRIAGVDASYLKK